MRKQEQIIPISGMNKDLSISKFNKEFTYNNLNMRINSDDSNTLFTLTNERGTLETKIVNEINDKEISLLGSTIGYSILNDFLVLFTTDRDSTKPLEGNEYPIKGTDRIYRIKIKEKSPKYILSALLLYEGVDNNSLNFSIDSPIETLSLFESDKIQKIYWVDKNNQPRFINITYDKYEEFNKNSFDFSPELKLEESYSINREYNSGLFHSGIIQYAFSYWNINGVETNLFLTTDIYTLNNNDRGGSPEDTVNCSFNIELKDVEKSFDYIRMYAIQRTSLDAVPTVRIVSDVEIDKSKKDYLFFDDGKIGSNFPADSLAFIGGEELIIGTISNKDNAFFGGNVILKRPSLEDIKINENISFQWEKKEINIQVEDNRDSTIYNYSPYTLENDLNIRHWKKGETYRIGIQAQYKTGIWSEIIYLGDYKVDKSFQTTFRSNLEDYWLNVQYVIGRLTIDDVFKNSLLNKGFKKIRPVYVPLTMKDRSIVGQGILTNTIANVGNRGHNAPFAYPDYYARGQHELVPVTDQNSMWLRYWKANWSNTLATYPVWQHFSTLAKSEKHLTVPDGFGNKGYNTYNEIRGGVFLENLYNSDNIINNGGDKNNHDIDILKNKQQIKEEYGTSELWKEEYWEIKKNPKAWFIDSNLVNFWSPDVEFGDVRHNLNNINKISFRGTANISASNIQSRIIGDNGARDSFTLATTNYSLLSSRVPSKYTYNGNYSESGGMDTDASVEYSYVWDAKSVEKKTAFKYLDKKIERLVYCGFNDMFADGKYLYRDIYNPKFIDNSDNATTYNTNDLDGANGSINYMNTVNEVIGKTAEGISTTEINYKVNKHVLFSFKESLVLPQWDAATSTYNKNEKINRRTWWTTPYYRWDSSKISTSGMFTAQTLDNNELLGPDYSNYYMCNRETSWGNPHSSISRFSSGYPYFWIIDLYKDIPTEFKYGGNTKEAINNNKWIPCGNDLILKKDTSLLNNLVLDRGDTYIQRYDCLRTYKGTSEFQNLTEVVSVILETFTNLDTRWDTKRKNMNIGSYTPENYVLINSVYNQKNNLFEYSTLDYALLQNDHLSTSFIWSEPKIYNELVDKWTGLWLNNSYSVEGNLGPINKIIKFRNELYGFQDKGIFNILYNTRVQIPTSDNVPIEIAQSLKTQGVRYLSNTIGATNKEAIVQSNKSLYFIDPNNKSLFALDEVPVDITETLGFKTWGQDNLKDTSKVNWGKEWPYILSIDYSNNDLYLSNTKDSLMFSERLKQFESFMSYGNNIGMCNIWEDFISIRNNNKKSEIWINKKGDYNKFYDKIEKSSIEFYLNPDMPNDKVFDNFQYRSDIFKDSLLVPNQTFDTLYVENEYQKSEQKLMIKNPLFKNKKFRIWSFPFPRQNNSLNRIRNPWIKMKLEYDGKDNKNLLFHDLIITYNI